MEDKKCTYCDRKESEGYIVNFNKKVGMYLCNKHRSQINRCGEILERTLRDKNEIIIHEEYAEIVLRDRNNQYVASAIIDIEDIEKIKNYKWHTRKSNNKLYVQHGKNKMIILHRLIMDVNDKNIHVDHINGDTLDNRRCNLRECTNQENSFNKKTIKNNTGIIGVLFNENTNKYEPAIKFNYKRMRLGVYVHIEDAIKARLLAEKKYFKEFAPQKHLFKQYGIECDTDE